MKIGVVGIGRVGLPFAAVCSKHFDTIGIDISESIVQAVNHWDSFAEPEVEKYIRAYNLKASTNFKLLSDRDLVFFFVGSQTPGLGYSSKKLLASMEMAAPYIREKQVLVISTTIPPGELSSAIIPRLESIGILSKSKGLGYSPAMIALGSAINDFEKPNYIMIGESNKYVGDIVEKFWRVIAGEHVPIFRSSIANIALAKYTLNIALVMKISLMSLVTELCEKQSGDVDVIASIFKAEPRIAGTGMFRGGLGYGGTCFPVDVEAIRHECDRLGVPTSLLDAVTELNEWQVERSVAIVKSFRKKKISVLGLTYKANTSIVEASQGLEIARRLSEEGLDVTVYDPEGMPSAKTVLGDMVTYARSLTEAISESDVIFVAVDWPEFKDLKESDFNPSQIVIDPWRLFKGRPLPSKYYGFGIGGKL